LEIKKVIKVNEKRLKPFYEGFKEGIVAEVNMVEP
jgi:hypothetical protein